jgi:6-phospho-beta-glucosidase
MSKITIIGGGGVRTPLLVHGLIEAEEQLNVQEIALYDIDRERLELIGGLCRAIVRQLQSGAKITIHERLENAVEEARFVVHSIRVGGVQARAQDERLAIEMGVAGQETTGFGGFAKAMRTIPVALEHARLIERYAPDPWFISFTNPAGLLTQALLRRTSLRVVGVCDTPSEMFHRIALALGQPLEATRCNYFGLNHLGWIDRVTVRGLDMTTNLLASDRALASLYHAELFDPKLIRALGLIPSEYLFFYYRQKQAHRNQQTAGASRGEEIERLNVEVFDSLRLAINAGRDAEAIELYRNYLRRRSGSYMKLEAEADSALREGAPLDEDPFQSETGYHRIAIETMRALTSDRPTTIVLNVANRGAITDLEPEDVVEVPCLVDSNGPVPTAVGRLPEAVRGLTLAMKAYERITIDAAIDRSVGLVQKAMLTNPLIGDWDLAERLLSGL